MRPLNRWWGRLRPVAAVLLPLLAIDPVVASERCPATENALVGTWSRQGDAGFFELFALEADAGGRSFDSWLHERAEISGADWALEDCYLTVAPRGGALSSFRFKILSLEGGRLHLRDESNDTVSVYLRESEQPEG